jgi:hypothetical protein
LPFVLFQTSLANEKEVPEIWNDISPYSFTLDLAAPPEDLRVLGTGGLADFNPESGQGSYSFLSIAEPESRRGVVAGWLTHDRGSGVLFPEAHEGSPVIRATLEYGRLIIPPDTRVDLERFVIGAFNDARLGLEAYADAVARQHRIKLPPIPSGYCTWYSRPHGGASDQQHLLELGAFAAEKLGPYGFDFVQIDDGWQMGGRNPAGTAYQEAYLGRSESSNDRWWSGPDSDFTRFNPEGPYPGGMAKTAEELSRLGLRPGIWLMPFAWTPLSPTLRDHHDWFVKQKDGSLYYAYWAGWCLDMTHPDARAFLGDTVSAITRDWGYRYLKLDGLWTGMGASILYVNNAYREDDLGESIVHTPEITPVEAYRMGLSTVRKSAGEDVFLLGCNVSQNMRTLGASFGLVDAMRIGPDNGSGWDSLKRGPWHGSNRYFLHGRVWYNDPDPVYVRDSMPLEHARLICSWVSLTGQLFVASDWLPGLPEERLDILRRTMANHGLRPRPVDLFESELPGVWLLTKQAPAPRRDVIGLFNWSNDAPMQFDDSFGHIGLPGSGPFLAFDYWADRFLELGQERFRLDVPAGSCRILSVIPAPDRPRVLSSNRHISQGMTDIDSEEWNAEENTLRGRSSLVGGDSCELRIAAGRPGHAWKATSVEVGSGDPDGTIEAEIMEQDGWKLRIRFEANRSQKLDWAVHFEPQMNK